MRTPNETHNRQTILQLLVLTKVLTYFKLRFIYAKKYPPQQKKHSYFLCGLKCRVTTNPSQVWLIDGAYLTMQNKYICTHISTSLITGRSFFRAKSTDCAKHLPLLSIIHIFSPETPNQKSDFMLIDERNFTFSLSLSLYAFYFYYELV